MDNALLILIVIFGIAVQAAVQGYGLFMQGQSLLKPEERQKVGGRLILTGIGLILVGGLVATVAGILFIFKR